MGSERNWSILEQVHKRTINYLVKKIKCLHICEVQCPTRCEETQSGDEGNLCFNMLA